MEMTKGTRRSRRIASGQSKSIPYSLSSTNYSEDMLEMNCAKIVKKKDWENVTCSVCLEFPHNAVLLLCSSHEKGCHPYMCGTSFHYSNCLDQYKEASTKLIDTQPQYNLVGPIPSWAVEKRKVPVLACPLCRGQVKGWTVVKTARKYLNTKKRSCAQDNCSFVGTYKELQKHVRSDHPVARPREVDPQLEQKWWRLEREQEREDVISTIRSSAPQAVVFGDYVIEGRRHGFDSDEEEEDEFDGDDMEMNDGYVVENNLMNAFVFLQAYGSAGNFGSDRGTRGNDREAVGINRSTDQDGDNALNSGDTLVSRLRRRGIRAVGFSR